MRVKTVLFISPTGTFDNGAEISIFNLMCYLVQQNYRVINIAPQSAQVDYVQGCQNRGIELRLVPTLKWWWEDAPGGLVGSEIERSFYYRDTIGRLRCIIQDDQVDVVLTNTVNMFQGAVSAACERVPHYWIIHEFPENEFAYYLEKIDFIEENSDAIYAVTGSLTATLTTYFQHHQIELFTPFTEIGTSSQKKGTKHRIVSVGRLTQRKNQLELIKAYQLLENKSVELVFIGDWDEAYKELCDHYIKTHHITGVHFLGALAKPWSILTSKDICVFTSEMETFGLVYVEAILNGIPTILSDNPGHQSAFDLFQVGQVYQLGNVEELTQLIRVSFDQFDQLKAEAVKQIIPLQEKYTVSISYANIIDALENLKPYRPKAIRHLTGLLSSNEGKSKLSRLETKIRRKINQILKR